MNLKTIILSISILMSVEAMAQIDRSKMPEPGPTPTINLGKPYTFQLDNGLTVLVVENHKLPRVIFSLTVDNPPIEENDKAGLSSLISSVVGNGTKNISKDDFNEKIDFIGANLYIGANGAGGRSLSKYADDLLAIMSDAIINPLFTQEELDVERKKTIEGLKNSEKNAAAVSSRVGNILFYGIDHPYGEYTTEETLNNITLEDLEVGFAKSFTPKNAYLIVSGDIKTEKAKTLVQKYFGNWKNDSSIENKSYTLDNADHIQINFVDMPNAVQSELTVGNLVDIKMADEDHHAALITNYILGGAFGSYLNMNLREQHGYTYGARSSIGRNKYSTTTFKASTKVRNEVTDSAIVQMLYEIDRIVNEDVSEKDLENAKAKYLGSFIMALEDPSKIADYALNIKTQNLPQDFYENFIRKINAVTKEDIKRIAQKYIKLDNARIIVVGKGKDVLEGLEKITFKDEKIPVYYFDNYGNTIDKPNYDIALDPSLTTQTVLANYIDALGGKKALENVKSISLTANGSMQGMSLHLVSKTTSENQTMVDVQMNGTSVSKQIFDGEKGFVEMQGQRKELEGSDLETLKKSAYPFPELHMEDDASLSIEGIETVEGKEAYVIKTSETQKIYYDKASGLKIQEVNTQEVQGQVFEQITKFSDYKTVDGIQIPHMISQSFGPQSIEFKVEKVEINSGVSPEDFK